MCKVMTDNGSVESSLIFVVFLFSSATPTESLKREGGGERREGKRGVRELWGKVANRNGI